MIKTQNISKQYGDTSVALHDVSVHVEQGEIVYVLGASGSGKSTLLKIIAGLEDADKGEVFVDNEKITGPKHNLVPGYSYIAHVSQDFQLQPYLRIRENIARKIPFLTQEEKEKRILALLTLCGLSDKIDAYPPELSGGEKQRVCIVANLAHEPEILLLDEPFSNLDIPHKRRLRQEIIGILRSERATVLVVSHDPEEAMAAADRILIMKQGRVIQFDTPQNIYQSPVSAYAASFLGPINIITTKSNTDLIRPEYFEITSKGHQIGTVKACWFQGSCYHLYVESACSAHNILIYAQHPVHIGEAIKFELKQIPPNL